MLRRSLYLNRERLVLTCIFRQESCGFGGLSVPRIMIADDRESMRSALRSLLVLRPGWVVCGEAETAKEAITKAAELRPDLIVLDYKLQTSDGIAAADGIGKF